MKLLPKTISLGIAVCCFCSSLYAQTTSSTKPAEEEEQKFSFGNISPVILKKDGIEVSTTRIFIFQDGIFIIDRNINISIGWPGYTSNF